MPNPPSQKPNQPVAPRSPQRPAAAGTAQMIPPKASAVTARNNSMASQPHQINPEFIERYQIELQKNPRSRVFAPLAEAYRKMGMIPEALRICRVGVGANPEFSGGLVAYAKVLIETGKFEDALTLLRKATTISPDNLLAHSLMGDSLLELRKPKEALKSFKMVLFLNPDDEKAKTTVRKWEFLTADEFDDEEFAMRPLFDAGDDADEEEDSADSSSHPESLSATTRHRAKELERALSLADAFTLRNDLNAALETLLRAERTLGTSPDITNRLAMLARRTQVLTSEPDLPIHDEADDEPEDEPKNYTDNQTDDEPNDFEESVSSFDDEEDDSESFTMSRISDPIRIQPSRSSTRTEIPASTQRASSHAARSASIPGQKTASSPSQKTASYPARQPKGLQARIKHQRRVAQLETLLHRISERRLDR